MDLKKDNRIQRATFPPTSSLHGVHSRSSCGAGALSCTWKVISENLHSKNEIHRLCFGFAVLS
jgi:hypothetical protein